VLRSSRLILLLFAVSSLSSCLCFRAADNFSYFTCRSRQAEAKAGLESIHVLQLAYIEEHGRYGSLEEIGFEHPGKGSDRDPLYRFTVEQQGEDGFIARAEAMVPQGNVEAEDVWIMDEAGEPVNDVVGCLRPGGDL